MSEHFTPDQHDHCECGHPHEFNVHDHECECGCHEEAGIDFAEMVGIEGEPVRALRDILALLEDEELMLATELYAMDEELPELEGLSREELIDCAFEALTSPDIHVLNLRSLQADVRDDYLWIMEEGLYECSANAAAERLEKLTLAESEESFAATLREIERAATVEALAGEMMVFPFLHDDMVSFVVPDEIREACKSVATEEFLDYVKEVELVVSYIDAATNLYGVIAVEDVIDLIAAYEPNFDAATAASHVVDILEIDKLWPHFASGGIIAHPLFSEGTGLGEAMAADLLAAAAKVPRYQPERDDFLAYAYPDYDEENFEAELLYELLSDLYPDHDTDQAFEIVQFVQQCGRQGMRNEVIIDSLFEDLLPEPLANEGQASLLIKQLAKVVHTTRTWGLNGHTPEEAEKL